jgi:hypothetical protein
MTPACISTHKIYWMGNPEQATQPCGRFLCDDSISQPHTQKLLLRSLASENSGVTGGAITKVKILTNIPFHRLPKVSILNIY